MNCAKAQGLLSPHLDGELAATARAELLAHLHACPTCRAEEGELRRLRQLFAGVERVAAPVGFSTRVMANLEPVAPSGLAWRGLLTGVVEVAFLGIIIVSGIVSGNILATRLNQPAGLTAALALDLFDPAPPDSLGGVYLAMLEVEHER